jgi:hypothetical protein
MVIQASVESTKTTRAGYVGSRTPLPNTTLRDSTQTSQDNPVLLIRGCRPIALTLAGTASTHNVDWQVERVGIGFPVIGMQVLPKGRTGATLLTNLRGLHVVRATQKTADSKGMQSALWHVTFADVETLDFDARDNRGLSLELTGQGKYVQAMGGVSYKIRAGINHVDGNASSRVHVSTIQNWVDIDARSRGCYGLGVAAPNVDLLEPVPPGGGPYNDGEEDHQSWPFDRCVKVEREGPAVTIKTSDVPGSSFPCFVSKDWSMIFYPNSLPPLTKYIHFCKGMHGTTHFVIAVAARSEDAPNTFVVCKLLRWRFTVNAQFRVEDNKLTPTMNPVLEAVHMSEQTLSPPVDAREAGIEIYGPQATGEGHEDAEPTLEDYSRQAHVATGR